MSDRKRKVEQAIKESVELSAAPAPKEEKKPKKKAFQLNPVEKANAAAPLHPRAAKSQRFRNKELQAGIAAGREANPASSITPGVPTMGHKQVKNTNRYDSTESGAKNYKAITSEK
jgi:hypothetical protein